MTAAEFAAALKQHAFVSSGQRSKTRPVDVPALGGRPFSGGEAWITTARSRRSSANAMQKSRGEHSRKPSRTSIVRLLSPALPAHPNRDGFTVGRHAGARSAGIMNATVLPRVDA